MNLDELATYWNRPLYDPPFESPIEDEFDWAVVKYLFEDCRVEKQYWVDTFAGRFRLDFVIHDGAGRRVGFECDGKRWHDTFRDECRDAVIVWEGGVDVIYRLRGTDIVNRLEDALALISGVEPTLFSSHGRTCLYRLASFQAREKMGEPFLSTAYIEYPPDDYDDRTRHLKVSRHARLSRDEETGPGRFLRDFYDFAVEQRGKKLDQIIAEWQRNRWS